MPATTFAAQLGSRSIVAVRPSWWDESLYGPTNGGGRSVMACGVETGLMNAHAIASARRKDPSGSLRRNVVVSSSTAVMPLIVEADRPCESCIAFVNASTPTITL